ncbi:hypothetical protein G6F42_024378 [Rhizopus arrhizus]|nr:hypothetical protein G6F42_024378 [Rhizopus arrhizus]
MDFSAIHLSSPGLYADIPRFSTSLPATVSELEADVPTLLCNLLMFRSYAVDATEKLKCSLHQKMNSVSSIGRMNNNSISETQYWVTQLSIPLLPYRFSVILLTN